MKKLFPSAVLCINIALTRPEILAVTLSLYRASFVLISLLRFTGQLQQPQCTRNVD